MPSEIEFREKLTIELIRANPGKETSWYIEYVNALTAATYVPPPPRLEHPPLKKYNSDDDYFF